MSAVSRRTLAALALIAVAFFALALSRTKVVRTSWYDDKIKAARIAEAALVSLKRGAADAGVAIDPINDPHATGIIGPEFSPISTDRGVLNSKLIVTNPNMTAAVVDMLRSAGLGQGDAVAVAFTGSFPGANVAVLAACEALGIRPLIITSLGASSYGATNPGWTWLDMERLLVDNGIFHARSLAVSIGGGKDRGRGLSEEGRALLRDAATRDSTPLIEEDVIEESIRRRLALYDAAAASVPQGGPVKAFVNVGGGLASLGAAVNGRLVPTGLTTHLARKNFPTKGVLIRMAERGIPIIHLLEFEQVARLYKLPLDPSQFGPAGQGRAFEETRYDPLASGVIFLMLAAALIVAVRVDLRAKWRQRRNAAADDLL